MKVIDQASGANWVLFNGDSCEVLKGIPTGSVGLWVGSPPFSSQYSYSPSDRDLGNVRSEVEFWRHYSYITRELLRVTMPGRIHCVHIANRPTYSTRDGVTGRRDLRGALIRHYVRTGFIYYGEFCIDKNPQAAAQRNHPVELLFATKRRDSAQLAPAIPDTVVIFKAPGTNPQPVKSDVTDNEWIRFAHPVWTDIRETDVLDVLSAKETPEERHLCPLQLGVIERCVRLYSNPGDIVHDCFAGVGSTGVVAVKFGRKFLGVELKPSYWKTATENLKRAEEDLYRPTLFGPQDFQEMSAG